MAAVVTITEERSRSVRRTIFTWTSAADGTASGTITSPLSGQLLRIVTNPDAGGAAPTDNYDVTLTDEDGIDVAEGLLANRDTANSEEVVPLIESTINAHNYASPVYVDGLLTLTVSNAGSGKSGVVTVYWR